MTLAYSVLIPVKNEEESLPSLIEEIDEVMTPLAAPWELLLIDDGSTDQSLSLIKELQKKKRHLRYISFSKNFGQSAAFACGFAKAKGRYVITLDGDGQNDPRDIPKLLAEMKEADLIVGWRKDRRDTFQKKIISKFSNAIRSRLCDDGVHDTGCSLKVYKREALERIPRFRGMHRFLPALFLMEGLKVKEVPVSHRERTKGKTKYPLFRLSSIADLLFVLLMKKKRLEFAIKEEK